MRLQRIKLVNFRNIRRLDWSPGAGLNVVVGANAAGKTNLCEALYYPARGLLLKGERQRELICWGEQQARLELELSGDLLRIELDARQQRRLLSLNGERGRQSEVCQVWQALLFSPDELQILKGSPGGRRRFFDQAIADLDPDHRRMGYKYDQFLRRKNALLKKPHFNRELLEVFNAGLVQRGARLLQGRLAYLRALGDELSRQYRQLVPGSARLELCYRSSLRLGTAPTAAPELQARLEEAIRELQAQEIARGMALVGPHRDDFLFQLAGAEMRRFSSQGEQKTALIALVLAQLELIRQRWGEYPVLILDDVLSELDGQRAGALLDNLPSGLQIFLTAIELDQRLRAQAGQFERMSAGRLSPLLSEKLPI